MPEVMDIQSSEALQWVSAELGGTLKDARRALEKFAENENNREPLGQVADLLHTAHGALRMVEVYGAALLAEEMVIVANALAERKIANQQEGLEALSRAMVQMPAYLDRVIGGGRDVPLILLPLLNDLRAVRGSPLLSESSLFILNVNRNSSMPEREARPDGENLQELARTLRPHFQSSLLHWLRGDQPEMRLDALIDIAQRFEDAATTTPVFHVWWVIGGVLEAIRDGGLRPSAAVKRLLGQGDRQIKELAQQGEEGLDRDPPTNLLNNLLFYVGRATSDGPKVIGIKRSFSLADMLEPDESGSEDATLLNAPSVNLMKTVGEAIRQDLAQVKDAIDIFVRTDSDDRSQLTAQRDALRKISDTLGVLGLDELRQQIATESRRLQAFVDGHEEADGALMSVAATLIAVEGALEEQLLEQIMPQTGDEAPASAAEMARSSDERGVIAAVLRECIVNFTRVKEALSQYVENPSSGAVLDPVPQLLRGITAGLLMLEKSRAVAIVERIAWHIERIGDPDAEALSGHEVDRLADAIVSVEYFMETVQKGRSDPEYMLDNADTCLATLRQQPPERDGEPVAPSEPAVEPAPAATAAPQVSGDELPDVSSPVVDDARIHVDPELLELFIEEAREEIATLRRNVPRWRAEQSNRELLLGIRRAFHTLKGSGRMVGANLIGEFAWSIEKVLNTFVNLEQANTEPLGELLGDALEALPQLVEQLEVGTAPEADLNLIAARANALAAGSVHAVEEEAEAEVAEEAAAADAPADESADAVHLDPVLYDIFQKETMGHLESINSFVAEVRDLPAPHRVPESLHRAWHTLSGSANMAAVSQVVEIASPMNEYLRAVFNDGRSLSASALDTMARASEAVETIVRLINTAEAPPDTRSLCDEILRLREAVIEPDTAPAALADEEDIAPAGEAGAPGFDPEIAAIFADEASEILELSDGVLAGWLDEDGATESTRIDELLRHLHTLKGGARMAGVMSMGTLSHELEALLQKLKGGEQKLTRACQDALRDGFDCLHSMQESLAEKSTPSDGADVVAQILALSGEPAAEEAAAPIEVSVAEELDAAVSADEGAVAESDAEDEEAVDEVFAAAGEDAVEIAGDDVFAGDWLSEAAESGTEEAAADEYAPDLASDEIEIGADDLAAAPVSDMEAFDELAEPAAEAAADADDAVPEVPAAAFAEPETPAVPEPVAEDTFDGYFHEAFDDSQPEVAPFADAARAAAGDVQAGGVHEPPVDVAAQAPAEEPEPAELVEPEAAAEAPAEADEPAPEPADAGQTIAAWPLAASGGEPETVESQPAAGEFALPPAPEPAADVAPAASAERRPDYARVDARMLDEMLNNAGEVSIFHSRIEQEIGSISFNLTELAQTVTRLRTQLRKLDAETEAQILHRHQADVDEGGDFDPLEMDRYSTIQQLSRALAESVSDLISIQDLLTDLTRESEGLLMQQARVTTELQDALIRTRMLPFSNYIPRLERVVRSAARDTGKRVDLTFEGGSGELDRQVLKRMMPPFEHMLRNAVVHGIEDSDARRARGKSETGTIAVTLHREGAEMVIRVRDDGAGLDVDSIKRVARESGLIDETSTLVGNDALNLILTPGFSTAREVTHAAGRGVGMDVVANEVKLLGGSLGVDSTPGEGTVFTARLPLTLAVTQSLLVRCGDERFAIPLPAVEGIVRVPRAQLSEYLDDPDKRFGYGDQGYRFEHLGRFVGGPAANLDDMEGQAVPVVLVRAGEHSTGLIADEMLGSREVVVKPVGPLVSGISGISGATILGDGSIVVILDVSALVRRGDTIGPPAPAPQDAVDDRPLIMVVDDSITVRRVTQRLLERNDMRVVTAKDGVDAVSAMEEQVPDLVLLDIEMPRMDGYEVATHIRNSSHLQELPIIMVTSRTGDKHRARAFELGVDGYLGKPYQENQLLDAIRPLISDTEGVHA